mmetsp:Transcript_16946/g.59232  ORF Transcript_16946/g.59232 Transcript_16946/m.59232 type:complete len:854 (+) Transcript_16946:85-2646(+)
MLSSMPPDLLVGRLPRSPPRALPQARGADSLAAAAPKRAASSAPSVKDIASAYEDVLRAFCDGGLIGEFEGLQPDAQASLLKALQVVVEETNMQLCMTERLAGSGLGGKLEAIANQKDHGMVDDACPVVRALRIHSSQPITSRVVDHLSSEVLPQWGTILPKPLMLMSYNIGFQKWKNEREKKGFESLSTNSTVVKPGGSSTRCRDWSAMRPVGISELRLFQVSSGSVLVGRLVTSPMVTVGITTILEDSSGRVIQLGLYNQLPGGASGKSSSSLAEKMFPKGTRLRIAEPFLKIFRDGNRGVRVDDPADVRIEGSPGQAELGAVRQEGKTLVAAAQFHAAAMTYWGGLRGGATEVATLLSNRAQAQLKQKLWAGALRDAAAAVVICTDNVKAWQRYTCALEGSGHDSLVSRVQHTRGDIDGDRKSTMCGSVLSSVRLVLGAALRTDHTQQGSAEVPAETAGSAAELKECGNQAYRGGRWTEAADLYSAAIAACPLAAEAALVLSNVALCSLQTGALHDVVAAASASLRLRITPKPLHHCAKALALLGEHALAEEILNMVPQLLATDAAAIKQCEKLRSDIARAGVAAAAGSNIGAWRSVVKGGIFTEWFSEDAIAVALFGSKGRGLRASRDVCPGEVLMVQRPRGSCMSDIEDGFLTSTNNTSRLLDDASKVKLKAQLTSAVCTDALLAASVAALSDGSDEVRPVVPIATLMNRLSERVLPLLLQHPQFLSEEERIELSHERVSRVVDINCHGESRASIQALESEDFDEMKCQLKQSDKSSKLLGGSTDLYPAISLMNHARVPTCVLFPFAKDGSVLAMAVVAGRMMPSGTELTVSYLDDPDAVKKKWGITD